MASRVAEAPNLFDYFNDRVEQARAAHGVRISNDTSLYLATLLTERARADRPAPPETTLAELHAHAAAAPPTTQVRAYRELGDRSLYLLGYFAESLQRRTVGPDYYADMGAAAYHRVDVLFKALFADAFGPVFHELAARFRDCVRLLSEVRDAQQRDGTDDLADLYGQWLATGDEEIRRRLLDRGLVIPRAPADG